MFKMHILFSPIPPCNHPFHQIFKANIQVLNLLSAPGVSQAQDLAEDRLGSIYAHGSIYTCGSIYTRGRMYTCFPIHQHMSTSCLLTHVPIRKTLSLLTQFILVLSFYICNSQVTQTQHIYNKTHTFLVLSTSVSPSVPCLSLWYPPFILWPKPLNPS